MLANDLRLLPAPMLESVRLSPQPLFLHVLVEDVVFQEIQVWLVSRRDAIPHRNLVVGLQSKERLARLILVLTSRSHVFVRLLQGIPLC